MNRIIFYSLRTGEMDAIDRKLLELL
ncbi:transcriptional regulator, partial [Burkholderia pseudomallei]